jgi:hypothetical protein
MNDHSMPDDSIRVRKRDGNVEPFVLAKLLAGIRAGLATSGEMHDLDTSTAGGLGEAVYDYLKSTYDGQTVLARQLSDLVELVLSQTGHACAATAFRDYERFRDRQRRILKVATPRLRDGRITQVRWNKSRLVEHLQQHHGLDRPAARMIAGRVEQLVFCCGLRAVTAGLVREMAASELLAWGLVSGAYVVKRNNCRAPRAVRENRE